MEFVRWFAIDNLTPDNYWLTDVLTNVIFIPFVALLVFVVYTQFLTRKPKSELHGVDKIMTAMCGTRRRLVIMVLAMCTCFILGLFYCFVEFVAWSDPEVIAAHAQVVEEQRSWRQLDGPGVSRRQIWIPELYLRASSIHGLVVNLIGPVLITFALVRFNLRSQAVSIEQT